MNIQRKMKMIGRRASDLDIDDILGSIGLARRRNVLLSGVLGAVGFLVVGAAVGAGVGLLFAPSSGRRMRQNVQERIANVREKLVSNGPGAQDQPM